MAGHAVARGRGVVAARRTAKLSHFVLPDHKVGSAAAPASLGPLEAALGFDSTVPHRSPGPRKGHQDRIDELVASDPGVAKTAFALIDLTTPTPRFAGHRATAPLYPASMGKLMLMLGAFQLRFDLQCLAEAEGITDAGELLERAADLLDDLPVVAKGASTRALRAGAPSIELEDDRLVLIGGKKVSMGAWGAIDLAKVFDPAGGTRPLRFRDDGLGFHQLYYLEYVGERKDLARRPADLGLTTTDLSRLGFMDLLRLMIGFSNNIAPRHLARRMGMVHANSPLWRAELFQPERGGLWLGGPYWKGHAWRGAPVGGGSTTASALSLATLFAALFRDQLVDPAGCAEMRLLLQKAATPRPAVDLYDDPAAWAAVAPGAGTRSFVGGMIDRSAVVHSKLGIYRGYSDTAHVERVWRGKTLRYVVSILDVSEANSDAMDRAVQAIDRMVETFNA